MRTEGRDIDGRADNVRSLRLQSLWARVCFLPKPSARKAQSTSIRGLPMTAARQSEDCKKEAKQAPRPPQ
eukprot:10949723-Alexandrium_andersonii.AAC.1